MRLIIIVAIILLIFEGKSSAQWRQSPLQLFEEAFEFYSYGEYNEALPVLSSLLRDDNDNDYLRYLIAVCYLNIDGHKQKALPYLEKAVQNISLEHMTGSFFERSAPSESLFYLGQAYRLGYRFDESLESFNNLKRIMGSSYDMKRVDRESEITRNAAMFYRNKEDFIILPLNTPPLSDNFHTGIIISGDEAAIVYTEPQKFYDAVFYRTNIDNEWSKPVNITMHLGSDGLAYPASLSWDGKELYLYQYDRFSNTNLYVSRREDNRWSVMEKLSDNINSAGFEQHGSLTRDGNTLYFSSTKHPGKGGFDIYRSEKDAKNNWGPAENLGNPVNTLYDESYPFISPDGTTLFFSSTGHTGMGDYDIFVTHKTPDGNWTMPRNLGYPLNTPDNDIFFIPVNDTTAYINFRKEDNNDDKEFKKITSFEVDILPVSVLSLNVSKESSIEKQDTEISLKIEQIKPADSLIITRTLVPGKYFELEVPWGEYTIEMSSEGYLAKSLSVSIPEYYPENKYYVTTKLKRTEKKDKLSEPLAYDPDMAEKEYESEIKIADSLIIEIQPVFFDFDSRDLDEHALVITSKVAGLLNKHNQIKIELKGYTDAIGPSAYNKHLAEKRAESVANELFNNGIGKDRISITSLGMKNYIARNTTAGGLDNPEGRKYNRRVELIFSNLPKEVKLKNTLNIPEHLKK